MDYSHRVYLIPYEPVRPSPISNREDRHVHTNMKINGSNPASVGSVLKAGTAPAVQANSRGAAAASSSADQVQISFLSARLLETYSAEHSSRVARVSGALEGGGYHVEAQVVSANIIDEHLRSDAAAR